MTKEQKERVIEMYAMGSSPAEISEEVGIPAASVRSFCSRKRPKGGERCLQCGADLQHVPGKKKKKFCSDRCRMDWWHAHPGSINKQAYYITRCEYCGKEFRAYGNDHRKYCSRECYGLARRNKEI